MLNSRDISLLRADVAANCRIFLDKCRAAGLLPLVTCTVRDQEQQTVYYKAGTGGKTVTFHKVGVGLAFDICKNVKGQEYSDTAFFLKAAEIGERMGFTWGGRWTNVDMPHFQWDAGKKYKDADIIAGRLPPEMPLYESEDDEMDISKLTDKQVDELWERIRKRLGAKAVSDYAKTSSRKGVDRKIFSDGDKDGLVDDPLAPVLRQELVVTFDRLGLLD